VAFLKVYEALETQVIQGEQRIYKAMQRLGELAKLAETEESRAEAEETRKKMHERLAFIRFHGARIQQQVKFLAYHCLDTSIPGDAPTMGDDV
jgi:hypothetical protein